MRRPRVILYDNEQVMLEAMRDYFSHRNFEVLSFSEPSICPVYGEQKNCSKSHPCSDLMVANHALPLMKGIDLFAAQATNGCKLASQNKAISGNFLDSEDSEVLRRVGASFLHRPIDYDEFGRWVDGCLSRIDLSEQLAIRRKEERTACRLDVLYQLGSLSDLLTGTALNVSRQGLCLEVRDPLPKDRSLTLHTTLPLATSSALVRWTRQTDEGTYLIGLQCY